MSSISVVLVVANEENKLEACLESLQWADEIIVVDDESKDRTLEIASRYTPKLYQRRLDNFSNQKNYGIDLAKGEWILAIDADERVNPDLKESLMRVAKEGSDCH